MSDALELKPCPFCGGKALLTNREMPGCAFVVCEGCQAQGDDGTVERVVAAWNRRADLHRAEVEALEAQLAEAGAGLEKLQRAAGEVSRQGAVTGPQWTRLNIALLSARATLAELKGEDRG
jgi:Lar family restriction alleviation protein